MTLGYAWGYVPNEKFKSSTTVIHTLIEVVAKGGNLLLGVGPDANGKLSDAHLTRLKEIGDWLKENGPAIYNTRTAEVYRDGETFFTRSKDNKVTYALVRLPEDKKLPALVTWKGTVSKKAHVKLVATGKVVKWKQEGESVKVFLPASFHGGKPYAAVALAIE
jgi:alpha-L-fucosidase